MSRFFPLNRNSYLFAKNRRWMREHVALTGVKKDYKRFNPRYTDTLWQIFEKYRTYIEFNIPLREEIRKIYRKYKNFNSRVKSMKRFEGQSSTCRFSIEHAIRSNRNIRSPDYICSYIIIEVDSWLPMALPSIHMFLDGSIVITRARPVNYYQTVCHIHETINLNALITLTRR